MKTKIFYTFLVLSLVITSACSEEDDPTIIQVESVTIDGVVDPTTTDLSPEFLITATTPVDLSVEVHLTYAQEQSNGNVQVIEVPLSKEVVSTNILKVYTTKLIPPGTNFTFSVSGFEVLFMTKTLAQALPLHDIWNIIDSDIDIISATYGGGMVFEYDLNSISIVGIETHPYLVYQEALAYCDSYAGGGFTDWIMPDLDNLITLYLYRFKGDIYYENGYYWSTTNYENDPNTDVKHTIDFGNPDAALTGSGTSTDPQYNLSNYVMPIRILNRP